MCSPGGVLEHSTLSVKLCGNSSQVINDLQQCPRRTVDRSISLKKLCASNKCRQIEIKIKILQYISF